MQENDENNHASYLRDREKGLEESYDDSPCGCGRGRCGGSSTIDPKGVICGGCPYYDPELDGRLDC